jgi:hypothetical protein
MPTQIFTVGKVVAVTFVHLPMQGKVTFVDISDDENTELLYRYCYTSSKFRKFAQALEPETFVVAEGEVTHHKVLHPPNGARSTLLVAGKVLRILQRPAASISPDPIQK